MTAVGESAWVHAVFECVSNLLADHNTTEWYVTGVDTLREANEVWCNIPMVDSEPFTATTETGHYFIAHHHDAVAIAQFANTLQVSGWRNKNSVRANNRFKTDHGNRVWTFNHEYVFQMLQCALAFFCLI